MSTSPAAAGDPAPRTWLLYGHDYGDTPGSRFRHPMRTVEQASRYDSKQPVVELDLIEDPGGEYLGWIATGESLPTRVQRAHIFDVQFPAGHRDKEQRGQGHAVRLRIERHSS